MGKIDLPADWRAWAEDEVAAGHALSVEALAAEALADYRHRLEAGRGDLGSGEPGEAEGADSERLALWRQKLARSEEDVRAGRVYPAEEVIAQLRAKFGSE